MNFTQLNVFREVMESGSISQTAKKLGRTQPAISLAIKNLEKSLDIQLFERRGRRLIPVPEARYLMAEATEILDRMSTVSGTMKSLRNAQSGHLNLAAMPGPSAFIFPRFISNTIAGNGNFRITFSSRSSPQIRELASTQSIDFGFADFDDPVGKAPQYHAEIISAACFCAIHRDHPLARKSVVSLRDLHDEPMGTLHGNLPLSRKLALEFERAGAALNVVNASQFFLPLMPFISSGHCCSIVDPLTVVTEQELDIGKGKIRFIPLQTPIRYEYAILTPLYRPLSQFATRIKDSWIEELLTVLNDIEARPERL
ncbi:LysR family transcriptional regulator [Roseobacter sp. YSTF-M11]|uniref:LysR family transcriptional regulator n=1 Tax=Roseobacter insulae TaxID=2859783 RepID=A0A9X1FT78_9RHOB|nr:LysR family transcriptional regulator [Roseobacter insulae]MBW4707012.1 LysR family transcriptional regulator [Roseobacter insulae]